MLRDRHSSPCRGICVFSMDSGKSQRPQQGQIALDFGKNKQDLLRLLNLST